MEYISVRQAAEKWELHIRVVQDFCKCGRIQGAVKYERSWMIPADAGKPCDLRHTAKNCDMEKAQYLPYTMVSGIVPMSFSAPLCVPESLKDEQLRRQYQAEIAYIGGNFDAVDAYFKTVCIGDKTFVCACVLEMLVSIVCGDYKKYSNIIKVLNEISCSDSRHSTFVAIEKARVLINLSMIVTNSVPQWIADFNLNGRAAEEKLGAVYHYVKYLQCVGRFEELLATAKTTLELCPTESGFTVTDIYLRLMCASACHNLGRDEEETRWLTEAVTLYLKLGIVMPFAENLITYGGKLEKIIKELQPDCFDSVVKKYGNIWRNWLLFHNKFARDNITLILSLREYQLAKHIAFGLTYAQAAEKMNISVGRVKNMLSIIYEKLMISGKKELESFIL